MAHPQIYADARIQSDTVAVDELLFCAGLWRLWVQVESQRWLIKNSLDLAHEYGASGITAGSYSYSRGSDDVRESRELHDALRRLLDRQNLRFITQAEGPRSLLESLAEMGDRGN